MMLRLTVYYALLLLLFLLLNVGIRAQDISIVAIEEDGALIEKRVNNGWTNSSESSTCHDTTTHRQGYRCCVNGQCKCSSNCVLNQRDTCLHGHTCRNYDSSFATTERPGTCYDDQTGQYGYQCCINGQCKCSSRYCSNRYDTCTSNHHCHQRTDYYYTSTSPNSCYDYNTGGIGYRCCVGGGQCQCSSNYCSRKSKPCHSDHYCPRDVTIDYYPKDDDKPTNLVIIITSAVILVLVVFGLLTTRRIRIRSRLNQDDMHVQLIHPQENKDSEIITMGFGKERMLPRYNEAVKLPSFYEV